MTDCLRRNLKARKDVNLQYEKQWSDLPEVLASVASQASYNLAERLSSPGMSISLVWQAVWIDDFMSL